MKRKIVQLVSITLALLVTISTFSAIDLHKMVERQQYKKLRNLLFEDDVNPNVLNEQGKTALHIAIERGYEDIVDFLLTIKADPETADPDGNTALFYAIAGNSLSMTTTLLNAQANVDAVNNSGNTPLIQAVKKNHTRIVSLLLERDADLFIKNKRNESAVTIAAQKGVQALQLLISEDNINQVSNLGQTFLSVAVEAGLQQSVTHLLKMKADPELGTIQGQTITEYTFANCTDGNYARIAIQLIEQGMQVPESQYDYIHYYVNAPKIAGFYSRGGFPLHQASKAGHMGFVKYFLEEGFDSDKKEEHALSCLNLAIQNERYEIAKHLVSEKCDVNSRTPQGDTPLMLLLKLDNNAEMAEFLLKAGAKTAERNYWGASPLLLAIQNDYPVDLVIKLIKSGTNAVIRDNNGITPLHAAIDRGEKELIKKVLSLGANIHAIDNKGRTPFVMAINKDADFLSWFCDNINILAKDDSGDSLLHIAISNNSDLNTIKLLLLKGVPINQKNLNGNTPFITALKKGNVETSKLLLESGADLFIENLKKENPMSIALAQPWADSSWLLTDKFLNAKDFAGNTPLHWAVNAGKVDAATTLISLGADINLMNNYGRTPLHKAILKQDDTMIKLLFNKHVDTNIRDHAGNTAYHYIVYNNSTHLLELFKGKGMDLNASNIYGKTPLHEAVNRAALEITQALVDQGANIHIRDNWGRTAIHDAAASGNIEGLRVLIKAGASYTARDNGGETPLHYAVIKNQKNVSRYLLNIGADIYASNKNGTTPLDMVMNNLEVMDWFIDAGNVNSPDNLGHYPIHIALADKKPFDVILKLVDKSAELNNKDMKGESPLHYAMRNQDYESAKLFLDRGANLFALNKDGDSPFTYAIEAGQEILNWFISPQNLNTSDNQGNTALHLAAIEKNSDLFDYLMKRGADTALLNRDGYTAAQLMQM